MSSSYVAFIDAVGAVDAVKGVSGISYITNDSIRARHARGLVRDVGYDANLNYEVGQTVKDPVLMKSAPEKAAPLSFISGPHMI